MRPRTRRRILAGILVAGVLGFYAAVVMPTRLIANFFVERQHLSAELAALQRQNAALEREATQLASLAEQEHLAEQDYGMVPRGMVSVQILPSSPLYAPVDPSATATAARGAHGASSHRAGSRG